MAKAPISACIIARDEAKHIGATLESIRPYVQEIVVVDTGSSDDTMAVCAKYADKLERFTACNDENDKIIDFSLARNRSFALATQPWAMWIDADDVLVGGEHLAGIVAAHDQQRKVCILWQYDYDNDGQGNITMQFIRERLVKSPNDFHWISPVHETLIPKEGDSFKALVSEIKTVHRRREIAKSVESGRNLRILQRHYNSGGDKDPRTLYYLGLELGWTGNPDQAKEMHKRYIAISGWEDEKYLAHMEVCRHAQQMGQFDEAIEWALKAIPVRETWGEAFFSLCKSYYFRAQQTGAVRDWERAVNFARRYLASPPPQTVLFVNPMERQVEVHRFLVVACMNIGDAEGALSSCDEILKALPNDANTLFNKKVAQERLAKQRARVAADDLQRLGSLSPEGRQLFEAALEGKFRSKPAGDEAQAARPSTAPPRTNAHRDSGLDIVLFIGPGAERWNPDTIAKTGIGGSERMAWEMSKRLARLGHRVRVYADCSGLEGTFEGVEWLDHPKYRDISCDVLITSRRPVAVDDQFNVRRRATLCWVHDVHCGTELTYQRALKIDRFLCLSQWHKEFFLGHYDFVHPSQVVQTRNGIDLTLYEQQVERNPHRMFYSSSLDRGVYVALEAMPEIRQRVPDAELHIYYGLEVWKRFAPPDQLQQIAALEALMGQRKADGVVYHGRASEVELAKEQMASGVWAYSTWFSETSCLTGMQAQAAGCRIVTSPIAALNETVGARGTMIDGYWLAPDYRARFVDACVAAMTKPEDGDRAQLQQYARVHFGLDELARDWSAMFARVLRETEESPIVKYRTSFRRAA
jgi:glycosyltransferase involved in cell wall biosynthesis/tetratricopeptide (TPR) repeat protein